MMHHAVSAPAVSTVGSLPVVGLGSDFARLASPPDAVEPAVMARGGATTGPMFASRTLRVPGGERQPVMEEDENPLAWLFACIGKVQELSLPLMIGIAVAMVMANTAPDTYAYLFGQGVVNEAAFQPQKSTASEWSHVGDVYTFAGTDVPRYYPYNIAYFGEDVADGEVEARVNFAGRSAGLLMRAGTGSFYMCRLDSRAGFGVSVIKAENQLLKSQGEEPPDLQNTDITLKMSVAGSQIQCFKDGHLVASAEDDSFSHGRLGFATSHASATFTVLSTPGSCHDCLGSGVAAHGTELFVLSNCPVLGHALSFHFIANDIIMVFFFGLAAKEITEAALPGGSLNPPRKAGNPLFATLGGVIGPVVMYLVFLEIFHGAGLFGEGSGENHWTKELIVKGWGIVTATDISLAWLTARLVFGSGHPAIDYLLLLAVVDDAIGLIIIAVFYPDPEHPVEPIYLLLVLAGVLVAFLLRKWHFWTHEKKHQSWLPYVFLAGTLSWIGLIKAHCHPALALVPIVPFMPGPPSHKLESLNDEVHSELGASVTHRIMSAASLSSATSQMTGLSPPSRARSTGRQASYVSEQSVRDVLSLHREYSGGRGREITAGLHAAIVGNRVDPALKVEVHDEDGNKHSHACTLDFFEQSVKVYVDFGMFLFAVCNAGVEVRGLGSMTFLVLVSLLLGKFVGIFTFAKLADKLLGFPAPLGVGNRHLMMVALLGSIGLTVALFVSDVAFEDPVLKGDAKLGALLSGFVAPIAIGVGKCVNFTHEDDVHETACQQVRDALQELPGEEDESSSGPSSDTDTL